jgi:NAD(P)H-dependent FMN reductase
MKVLGIMGSPRVGGNSDVLLSRALEAILQEAFDLGEKSASPAAVIFESGSSHACRHLRRGGGQRKNISRCPRTAAKTFHKGSEEFFHQICG